MQFSRFVKANFQQPMVIFGLAVITAHLVLSSLFFMEAPSHERVFWAVAATVVLVGAALAYGGLSQPVRGLLCTAVGLPAIAVGSGIHAAHVVQIGFDSADYTGVATLAAGGTLALMGTVITVRLVDTWWRRLFLIPAGPVLVFFLVLPVTLGTFAANVAHVPCCEETPADHGFAYEDVAFRTQAGLALSAWYIPTRNGAVVVTVHGAGTNRGTTMPEALVLARNGYGVLMVDLEGFGDSEGRANAFGWVGARGVHAAIDYLRSRPDVDTTRIGGLGLSMGGEVLMQAAGESPHLRAVVSEGGTGRTAADFGELDDGWFQPIIPFHKVVGLTMHLFSGEQPPPPLKDMVAQIAPRRLLMIAGNIGEEKELMGMYLEIGGPSFELWTILEPKHVGAYDLHPEEYEQRVIAFFDDALLEKGGVAAGVR
jgi:hypothetical protein